MGEEMQRLDDHEVYDLVPITSVPKNPTVMGFRCTFKQNADGTLRARLVVQGHSQ